MRVPPNTPESPLVPPIPPLPTPLLSDSDFVPSSMRDPEANPLPEHPAESSDGPALNASSAEALDRLLDSGFATAFDPASSRAVRLLSLLNPPAEPGDAERARLLIDVTVARIARSADAVSAGRIGGEAEPGPALSDASQLDALVSSGWQADAPVAQLLASLDGPAADARGRDRLIDSTLARIHGVGVAPASLKFNDIALAPRSRLRITLNDVLAAAACVLLGTAILSPMIVGSRETTRETLCASALGRAGLGFSLFAADHDGALPSTAAFERGRMVALGGAQPGTVRNAGWWTVGAGGSHSSNLFTLVRGGYASPHDLACPGNQTAQVVFTPTARDWSAPEGVSFSYQLFNSQTPRWFVGKTRVVLADRSPVADRARRNEDADPMARSRNHNARGQNVLFNTAAVQFFGAPVLEDGDNIWLPKSLESAARPTLKGNEAPASDADAFVGP